MPALCVAVVALADGTEVLSPDATCAQGLVVVDQAAYVAMATNPLMIPMDQAPTLMLVTLGLFVAAYTGKLVRRALD